MMACENPIRFAMYLPLDINLNGGVEWFHRTRDEKHVKNVMAACRNVAIERGHVELPGLKSTHAGVGTRNISKSI